MPIVVFLLQCTSAWFSGYETKLKLSLEILHMSLHRQSQILMRGLDAFQGKFGRKIFSKLSIIKFH